MLTLYPDRRERRRISKAVGDSRRFPLAGHQLLLAGVVILAVVVLPWHAELVRHFSKTGPDRIPFPGEMLREGAIRDNDVFSSVLVHLRTYRQAIRNTRYLTIIDYTKPSYTKRMYLMDMETSRVERYLVSHGKNSGWVYASAFSNRPESFQSCRGFFVTGRTYSGKHGTSLQLHGLEKGVNDNASRRGIVMHAADYVSMRSVKLNGGRLGRSLGCPVIPVEAAESVINRIKGGSLLYIYTGSEK